MTAAQYQQATAAAAQIDYSAEKSTSDAAFAALESEYGKPVTVLVERRCAENSANPGAVNWGIAGALSGPTAGCGISYGINRETALMEICERANEKGWTDEDYVLLFVSAL